jgi:hypothetical protein
VFSDDPGDIQSQFAKSHNPENSANGYYELLTLFACFGGNCLVFHLDGTSGGIDRLGAQDEPNDNKAERHPGSAPVVVHDVSAP